jgi:hypothetical protein
MTVTTMLIAENVLVAQLTTAMMMAIVTMTTKNRKLMSEQ